MAVMFSPPGWLSIFSGVLGALWASVLVVWGCHWRWAATTQQHCGRPPPLHSLLTATMLTKAAGSIYNSVYYSWWLALLSHNKAAVAVHWLLPFVGTVQVVLLLALTAKGWCVVRRWLGVSEWWTVLGLSIAVASVRLLQNAAVAAPVLAALILHIVLFEYALEVVAITLRPLTAQLDELSRWMTTVAAAADDNVKPGRRYDKQLAACIQCKTDTMRSVWSALILYATATMMVQALRFFQFADFVPALAVAAQEVADAALVLRLAYLFRLRDQSSFTMQL